MFIIRAEVFLSFWDTVGERLTYSLQYRENRVQGNVTVWFGVSYLLSAFCSLDGDALTYSAELRTKLTHVLYLRLCQMPGMSSIAMSYVVPGCWGHTALQYVGATWLQYVYSSTVGRPVTLPSWILTGQQSTPTPT